MSTLLSTTPSTANRARRRRVVPALVAALAAVTVATTVTSVRLSAGASDPGTGAQATPERDTTPATCSFREWPKRMTGLRIGDPQSGVEAFAAVHTFGVAIEPMSASWSPPTPATAVQWSRLGRGPGVAVISHTNGAGVDGECALFVRRDGTARVVD